MNDHEKMRATAHEALDTMIERLQDGSLFMASLVVHGPTEIGGGDKVASMVSSFGPMAGGTTEEDAAEHAREVGLMSLGTLAKAHLSDGGNMTEIFAAIVQKAATCREYNVPGLTGIQVRRGEDDNKDDMEA